MRRAWHGLGWRQIASSVHGNLNVGLVIGCVTTVFGATGLIDSMTSTAALIMNILSLRAMMVKTPGLIMPSPATVTNR